jgi:hypothetical protein
MEKTTILLAAILFIVSGCKTAPKKPTETISNEAVVEQNNKQNDGKISTDSSLMLHFRPHVDTIPIDSILFINETCLIEVWPEPQHFEDEASEEAKNYFIIMDDFAWYTAETRERFEKMGIKSVSSPKRYLSFMLSNNERVVLDTKEKSIGALLYKKGHLPIMISLPDNNMEDVHEYLRKQ